MRSYEPPEIEANVSWGDARCVSHRGAPLANVRVLEPKRSWEPGDEYWALWLNASDDRYFAHFEGIVLRVADGVIRFAGYGRKWRFVDEGLAFGSREAAKRYAMDREPSDTEVAALGLAELATAARPAFWPGSCWHWPPLGPAD